MIHIKTPARAIDTATETLIWDAEDELLAIGSGDAQGKLEIGEIIQALNEHDDLIAQRDALVAACLLFTRAYYGNGGIDVNWELYDRAGLAALAALALAKGEQ